MWLNLIAKLDKKTLAQVKQDLSGQTWVAEFLNSDNLVRYDEDQLVFHSIVENESGAVVADATKVLSKYGLPVVPSQSFGSFILEEESLQQKIEEIQRATLVKPISETQEGLVLHMIDKEQNSVLSMFKVKAVEYTLFRLMHAVLLSAIERGEIETQFERIIQNYTK